MIHALILHVTGLLVLAFFVLFAAGKADGFVRLLGIVLGGWLIVLAVLAVVLHVAGPMMGDKPFGMDMQSWHHGWMHRDQSAAPASSPAQPPAPAPAKPPGH